MRGYVGVRHGGVPTQGESETARVGTGDLRDRNSGVSEDGRRNPCVAGHGNVRFLFSSVGEAIRPDGPTDCQEKGRHARSILLRV